MNAQFRACIREMFQVDSETNEWRGRWEVAGMTPSGLHRQFTSESIVENINHPVAERETAVAQLWAMVKAEGLVPAFGVLELPKRQQHLARYLA